MDSITQNQVYAKIRLNLSLPDEARHLSGKSVIALVGNGVCCFFDDTNSEIPFMINSKYFSVIEDIKSEVIIGGKTKIVSKTLPEIIGSSVSKVTIEYK